MEKQILEIVKQRDEYPISIEINNDNAKGEPKLTIKARFEVENMTEADLHQKVEMVRNVWFKEQEKLSGGSD
ncbi:MAG: hypothetical protein QXE82_00190 [Candidatus Nitrosotenuis sp.]